MARPDVWLGMNGKVSKNPSLCAGPSSVLDRRLNGLEDRRRAGRSVGAGEDNGVNVLSSSSFDCEPSDDVGDNARFCPTVSCIVLPLRVFRALRGRGCFDGFSACNTDRLARGCLEGGLLVIIILESDSVSESGVRLLPCSNGDVIERDVLPSRGLG